MNGLHLLARLVRSLLLIVAVAFATICLVRYAPGYFSDAREMDARYADAARSELATFGADNVTVGTIAGHELEELRHGTLGISREYQVPVALLLQSRLRTSGGLIVRGVALGWLVALFAALPVSALRRNHALFTAPFTVLLAIPIAALATACLLAQIGGPLLILSLVVAARDFRFVYALLFQAWRAPHQLFARAQGIRLVDRLRIHTLPSVAPELKSLMGISIVTSLSAIVPIEVLFNVPGIGQLAWNAVMNRDLPVLLAVTLIMAATVSGTTVFCGRWSDMEPA